MNLYIYMFHREMQSSTYKNSCVYNLRNPFHLVSNLLLWLTSVDIVMITDGDAPLAVSSNRASRCGCS